MERQGSVWAAVALVAGIVWIAQAFISVGHPRGVDSVLFIIALVSSIAGIAGLYNRRAALPGGSVLWLIVLGAHPAAVAIAYPVINYTTWGYDHAPVVVIGSLIGLVWLAMSYVLWSTRGEALERLVREAKERRSEPASPTSSVGGGVTDELERLAELRSSGVLAEEEFQQAKRKILE